jgi:hypothetical protein
VHRRRNSSHNFLSILAYFLDRRANRGQRHHYQVALKTISARSRATVDAHTPKLQLRNLAMYTAKGCYFGRSANRPQFTGTCVFAVSAQRCRTLHCSGLILACGFRSSWYSNCAYRHSRFQSSNSQNFGSAHVSSQIYGRDDAHSSI